MTGNGNPIFDTGQKPNKHWFGVGRANAGQPDGWIVNGGHERALPKQVSFPDTGNDRM
ncbi:hypothetical protein AA0498_0526 [Acidomonas methanolica]|uniref:Uncharacterized protein n=1 Tax=Acidomonas methanolica NBRC 104435 TaxID=1231351 RepID=A0A023D837_ACIMT|nr:hypothetical protein Amme_089_007 [Acidomonas methanolica NBRC 104435]GBQ47436.1 hypothetical protein AA0498_0526 [Acidomonas methanolica]GEL00675.1 hypothetical protein AME01nite_31730 [Acidomonas methanolica NBRC 104435]